MPAMPNEKTTAVSLSARNFSELKLKGLSSSSAFVAATAAAAMASTAVTATITANGRMQQQTQHQQQQQQLQRNACACVNRMVENNAANKHVNGILPTSSAAAIRICCRLQNSSNNTASVKSSAKSTRNKNNNNNTINNNIQNNNNNIKCNNSSSENSNNSSCRTRNTNGHYQQQNQMGKDSVDYCQSASASASANTSVNCISNMNSSTQHSGGTASGNGSLSASIPSKKSPKDYIFGKYIGEGSYSTVYLAVDVQTKKEYAIKVCEKRHILREQKQEYIKREREVLHLMTNVPGFVNLSCTFQDHRSLYFVMTYATKGDLLPYINKVGSFDLDCTRHYAAELVLACEQMHSRNIVHRDLKPENILLDENMHTLIADFGSSKILQGPAANNSVGCSPFDIYATDIMTTTAKTNIDNNLDDQTDDTTTIQQSYTRKRKGSFVGTAQYVSPEVLNNGNITPSADLWALGCIIYQMIAGLPPFRGSTDFIIFKEILANSLDFPEGFDADAKDLVKNLLQLNPMERLGANDVGKQYATIRNHAFFKDIQFDTVRQSTPPPIHPYLPGVSGDTDFSHTHYSVPENLEPGLDEKQRTRLLGSELGTLLDDATPIPTTELNNTSAVVEKDTTESSAIKNNFDLTQLEKQKRLEQQKSDPWHAFCDNEIILRKGLVNKRKGLFARKRMLLLTTGPRLIYIDPVQMVKKGEIPWTIELRVEAKNFKIFFVHTPNRTYYLEDPEGYSLEWVAAINKMHALTFKDEEQLQQQQFSEQKSANELTKNSNNSTSICVTNLDLRRGVTGKQFIQNSQCNNSINKSVNTTTTQTLSAAPTTTTRIKNLTNAMQAAVISSAALPPKTTTTSSTTTEI